MKKYFVTIFLLTVLFTLSVYGQKPKTYNPLEIIPHELESSIIINNIRVHSITGLPIALYQVNYQVDPDSPEKMAMQYLRNNHKALHLQSDLNDLHFLKVIETPGGYHVHFQQYKHNYPVYNSTINVTISRSNKVEFVMNGYKEAFVSKIKRDLENVIISQDEALIISKNYLGVQTEVVYENKETIIYYNNGVFRLAQKINLVPSSDIFGDWEILVDAQSGEIFRAEDKALYTNGHGNSPTGINGSGWVFDPDPITHARTTYGTPGFTDNNDADSDSLTAHLEEKTLFDITLEGSNYILKGPWAEIRDFESPFTGLHTSTTTDFHYTRSDDNFEAVNTYHHIDQSMRYINGPLGFTLTPYQYSGGVRFDPHGLSGADNSHYITSTGSVAFGDGGVDDAEDISVIVHELGHGIHDWITNGGLSQQEGLSEGCGDYWAASYIRSTGYWTPSDPAYNWVFIWDGHNPFWPGRITNYTAHYPEGLTGQIHTDGQMWSSSLMSIYNLIGRTPTDSDFLEGLSMTNGSSNQQDAAYAFIQADEFLYGGANLDDIIAVFMDRGYIDSPVTADFTADVTGGQAPLTVQFTDLSIAIPGPIISWEWDFDNDGNIDSNDENPTWTYTENGTYTVSLTVSDGTISDTETKEDYISVNGGIYVWEGEQDGPNYSGTFIRNYLQSLGFDVTYSTAANLPSSMIGYDAIFLSFGNYGSSGSTYTEFTDEAASSVVDYMQNGGNVYLEGGDALGFNQSNNTTLLALFGLVSVADGSSSNTPVTNLAGQTGTLTNGMLFTSSSQPNNNWIDIYTPNASGQVSFIETTVGNVAVQNSGSSSQKTFCFSYAIAKLNDEVFPSTRGNILDKLIEFFEVIIPVELTKFSAEIVDDKVHLSWETATETNNLGFGIERALSSADNEHNWVRISFVEGNGTTTEKQSYSFRDIDVPEGKIYYRLKQIDYDGSFEYSNVAEVDLVLPVDFSLLQNYPNPFNPSTKIKFTLATDSKVTIRIYNIVGQQIKTLVNQNYAAGRHEITFTADDLSSGTYFYEMRAIDKNNNVFSDVKKMIVIK